MNSRIVSLTVLLLLLALAGCGVKGAPVQIGKPIPAAPTNLTLKQQGNDLQLAWTIPTLNQDGSELLDLNYFIISRLPYRAGDYCDECLDSGTDQLKVYLDFPVPASRIGNRLYLTDIDLPHNVGYRYRIIPVNRRGEAGAEARSHRTMLLPPAAPTRIQIVESDRSLRLSWTTEIVSTETISVLGINLYRAVGDAPFALQPVNNQPITEDQYLDFGLDNGQPYRYGLRSVIEVDGQQIESELSEIITAMPLSEF